MDLKELVSRGVRNEYNNSTEGNHLIPAFNSLNTSTNTITEIITKGKLPESGLSELEIELLINQLAQLDSNNWQDKVPAGEREGRVFSKIVAKRNYNLAHGIGRSGNLVAAQPKARGSSVILSLAHALACDALQVAGYRKLCSSVKNCLLLPVCTGMALNLSFMAIKKERSDSKVIIWARIDQASCYKSMLIGGVFEVCVVELTRDTVSNSLYCNPDDIAAAVTKHGAENVLAIHLTSSCFAPREPDRILEICKFAKSQNIPVVVNNAYGIQSTKSAGMIDEAFSRKDCSIDYVVSSMDKNFMVPVGGSIVLGKHIAKISQMYAGRASIQPMLDLMITLLEMGLGSWKNLLKERVAVFEFLKEKLKELEVKFPGLIVYEIKKNNIQIALELPDYVGEDLGAKLFHRNVTGCRVIKFDVDRTKFGFKSWGSHTNEEFKPYLTVAASIGTTRNDAVRFIQKLVNCLSSKK